MHITDGSFIFEKTNPDSDTSCDIYIAYYDENKALIGMEKYAFETGKSVSYPYNKNNTEIKEVRAFAWENGTFKPLGNSKNIELAD